MKTLALAVALAAVAVTAPAFAQDAHKDHAPAADGAQEAAPAAGALSVQTTPISEIIKNEKAKAALEAALPQIPEYYDRISGMTLAEVAPVSQGAIDDDKLKAIQAEFDKLK